MIVTLSKRNLLSLLYKLEMPHSQRGIVKTDGTCIMAESDEIHYRNRPPGEMCPGTEDFIIDFEAFLAMRKR